MGVFEDLDAKDEFFSKDGMSKFNSLSLINLVSDMLNSISKIDIEDALEYFDSSFQQNKSENNMNNIEEKIDKDVENDLKINFSILCLQFINSVVLFFHQTKDEQIIKESLGCVESFYSYASKYLKKRHFSVLKKLKKGYKFEETFDLSSNLLVSILQLLGNLAYKNALVQVFYQIDNNLFSFLTYLTFLRII